MGVAVVSPTFICSDDALVGDNAGVLKTSAADVMVQTLIEGRAVDAVEGWMPQHLVARQLATAIYQQLAFYPFSELLQQPRLVGVVEVFLLFGYLDFIFKYRVVWILGL